MEYDYEKSILGKTLYPYMDITMCVHVISNHSNMTYNVIIDEMKIEFLIVFQTKWVDTMYFFLCIKQGGQVATKIMVQSKP